MTSFIKYKKKKANRVFEKLGDNFTESAFIESFKILYPDDWQRIQDIWAYEEKVTPKGKKHPMPHPDVYMKEMYRNHKPKKE